MTPQLSWREQYGRIRRWRERLSRLNELPESPSRNQDIADYFHAFFVTCYHLKDWLKEDLTHGVPADTIEECVSNSPPLRLCGELANGSKHAVLKQRRGRDTSTRLGQRVVSEGLDVSDRTVPFGVLVFRYTAFEVVTQAGAYDAFQVADDVIRAWDEFLRTQGRR